MAPKVLNHSLSVNLLSCPLHIINAQTDDFKSPNWEQRQQAVRFRKPESSTALLHSCYFRLELNLILWTECPLLTSVQATSQGQTPTSTQECSILVFVFSKSNSAHAQQNPSLNQASTQSPWGRIRGFSKTASPP